ncbi:hypothetical protein BDZ89DRAFT_1073457 [Hymenopellis radicata]|nr:hypothetical protein BDZ89DRAFT_1073457 [Hymenopellis radicata]
MSCPEQGWFALPDSWPLEPLTTRTFITMVLPLFVAYLLTAVLVITPGTYAVRISLLPLSLWLAFRSCTRLEANVGNAEWVGNNLALMTVVGVIIMRITGWTFQRHHFVRTGTRERAVLIDACDLCCNFRGIGWDWTSGAPPPPQRHLDKRAFALNALLGYTINALLFEFALLLRDNIFPPSPLRLPFTLRRLLQALIYPISTYAHLQAYYHIYSLLGVFLLSQSPASWPPLFNRPWLSTSLSEFWGRRWHQGFRDMFGRVGGQRVLGTFLASGVFHDLGIWGMSRRSGLCCNLTAYFGMMALGIGAEYAVRRCTGKRVSGTCGRVWMVGWILGWAVATMGEECMHDFYRSMTINWLVRPVQITGYYRRP